MMDLSAYDSDMSDGFDVPDVFSFENSLVVSFILLTTTAIVCMLCNLKQIIFKGISMWSLHIILIISVGFHRETNM